MIQSAFALLVFTSRVASQPTPVPKDVPPSLMISAAWQPCRSSKGNNEADDMKSCADTIWDYERRIRHNLEIYLDNLAAASHVLPAYSAYLSDLEGRLQDGLDFVSFSNPNGLYTTIDDAQVAVAVLSDQVNNVLPAVHNNFTAMVGYMSNLPNVLTRYNSDLLNNMSNSIDTLITNQTLERENEIANMASFFDSSLKNVMDSHQKFMANFTDAVKSANNAITQWQTDQTGNVTSLSDKMDSVYNYLSSTTDVLRTNLQSLASSLLDQGVESLSNTTIAQTQALQEALNDAMATLNATYAQGVQNATDSAANLASADDTYAQNITDQVQGLRDQIDATLLTIANQTATQQSQNDQFISQLNMSQMQKISAMDLSLTDASSAAKAFQKLTNQTEIKGLLLTRQVLLSLNQMLDSVKGAVAKQTASFAAGTAGALSSQADGVASASAAGQDAARSAMNSASDSASQVTDMAGGNTAAMVGAVAELLDAVSKMSDVVKAKIGLLSDSSGSSIDAVGDTVNEAASELGDTVAQVAQAGRNQALETKQNLIGVQADTQQQAASLMVGFQNQLGGQLDAMNAAYSDVSAQGNQAITDASATVSDAASAVGDLQDASVDLASEAAAAQSESDTGFQQLSNVVGNTEIAAKQSIEQAKQALGAFISQQATLNAQALISLGESTENTFKGGFYDIKKNANSTFNDITNAFRDMIDEGKTVLSAVNAAGQNFPQLVNATIAKNASVSALVKSMITQAEANWDSTVASAFSLFLDQIASADSQTQGEIDQKLGSLRNLSGLLMGQINSKMHSVIARMVDISGEANLSSINYQQSVTGLNSSLASIQSSVSDALNELSNLQDTVDSNFASLATQTAAVDALIIEDGADLKDKVFAQNATLYSAINNMTNNAKAQVSHDTASFVNFTQSFLSSVNAQRAAHNIFSDTQSRVRIAILNELSSAVDNMRQDLLDAIYVGSSQNADMASQLTGVLNDLANSQYLLANQRGSNVASVKQKLDMVTSLVNGLSTSMQVNLNAAMNRINSDAQFSAAKSGANQATTLANQTSQVQTLGNSVIDMLNGVISAGDAANIELGNQQGQALQIASMVHGLSTNASIALRKFLSAIQQGKMTVQEALAAASTANSEGLTSFGDVAGAFIDVLGSFDSQTQLFIDSSQNEIDAYNTTALKYISDSATVLDATSAPLDYLSQFSQNLSDKYVSQMTQATAAARAQLSYAQTLQNSDAAYVSDVMQNISDKIASVTRQLGAIRTNESSYIQELTKQAQTKLRTSMRAMEHTYFPAVAQAQVPLRMDSVAWPSDATTASLMQQRRFRKASF